MSKERLSLFDLFLYVFMLILCIIIIYPFIYMIANSLSDKLYVMRGEVFLVPKGFSLKSFEMMVVNKFILTGFKNTVIYTLIGTLFCVGFTLLSAYPLSKKGFIGRKFFTKVIVFCMVFDGGLIPGYLVIVSLGLYNSIWSLILPTAFLPAYMIMTISYFRELPLEVEESAMIDGASVYKIFAAIIIPISKPLIAAMVIFYSMFHYNNFIFPLLYIGDRSKQLLQVQLRDMVLNVNALLEGVGSMVTMDYSIKSLQYATIIISILPVLIVYPFIQKQFVKGVMMGSVKG